MQHRVTHSKFNRDILSFRLNNISKLKPRTPLPGLRVMLSLPPRIHDLFLSCRQPPACQPSTNSYSIFEEINKILRPNPPEPARTRSQTLIDARKRPCESLHHKFCTVDLPLPLQFPRPHRSIATLSDLTPILGCTRVDRVHPKLWGRCPRDHGHLVRRQFRFPCLLKN